MATKPKTLAYWRRRSRYLEQVNLETLHVAWSEIDRRDNEIIKAQNKAKIRAQVVIGLHRAMTRWKIACPWCSFIGKHVPKCPMGVAIRGIRKTEVPR
jgi:hypothetical protein